MVGFPLGFLLQAWSLASWVFLPWYSRPLPWVVWLFIELSVMAGGRTRPKRQMGRIHKYICISSIPKIRRVWQSARHEFNFQKTTETLIFFFENLLISFFHFKEKSPKRKLLQFYFRSLKCAKLILLWSKE